MCFFLPPPSLYTIMFRTPPDSCAVHLISVPAFIHTSMHVLLVIQAWSFLVLWFFDWNSVTEWYKLIKSSLYSSYFTIVSFNSFFGCTISKRWSQTSELFFWHKRQGYIWLVLSLCFLPSLQFLPCSCLAPQSIASDSCWVLPDQTNSLASHVPLFAGKKRWRGHHAYI